MNARLTFGAAKLLLSALLVSLSVLAFAQGGAANGDLPRTIVLAPCIGERTAPGCEMSLDLPVYRPFESISRRETLTLPGAPDQSAPAFALRRDMTQWQQIILQRPRQLVVEVPIGNDSTLRIFLEASTLMNGSVGSGQQWEGAYYFGNVLQPDGRVRREDRLAVSFLPTEWIGLLFLEGQTWVMGGIPESGYSAQGLGDQALFQTMEIPDQFKNICADLNETIETPPLKSKDEATKFTSTTCKEVSIVFVIDSHTRALYASDAAATNWITGIFNAVKFVYANEGITINIFDIDILADPATDPFDTCTKTNSYLSTAQTYALARTGAWNLLHVVSRKNLGGGLAYLNVLCSSNRRFRTGVSGNMNNTQPTMPFPTPYYTWNVMVIAHELGHNFGSQHTHNCSWPGGAIDGCYDVEGTCTQPPAPVAPFKGTIMSYCHTKSGIGIDLNLGFGPLPGNRIRERFNSATCLSDITVTAEISPQLPELVVCAPLTSQVLTTPPCTNCSYQWFRDGNPIASATSTSHTATSAGEYHVVATNGACVATSAPLILSFSNGPTVSAIATPSTTLCPGNPATLEAVGGISHEWLPGNMTGPVITVNPTVTTTYTLIASDANGCINSTTVTVTVTNNINVSATASNTLLCLEGDPSQLTATGADSFEWLPGNLTGSVVTVNPMTSTTYTVIGTQGVCTATAQVEVVVFDATAPAVESGTFCVGQTGAQVCVINPQPGREYAWYDAPNSGNLLEPNAPCFSQFPTTAGVHTFYVEEILASCTTRRSASTLDIFMTQGPQANPAQFCTGQNAPMPEVCVTNPDPNFTYNWYAAFDATSTLPSGSNTACFTFDVSATGNHTIFVRSTDPLGCLSSPTPVAVTVSNLSTPTAVSLNPICPGQSVILQAASPSNGEFYWFDAETGGSQLNAGPLTVNDNLLATPTANGQCYWLERRERGCASPRVSACVSYHVGIPAAPAVQFATDPACIGQPITMSAVPATNPVPAPAFTWSGLDPLGNPITGLSIGQTINHTPTQSGQYTFCVIQSGTPCNSPRGCNTITVQPDPVPGQAAGPASVCSETSVTINLLNHTGAVRNAFFSVNNGITWQPVNPAAPVSGSSFVFGPVQQSISNRYCFRFQVGLCNPVFSQITCVDVIPSSVGGIVSSSQTVCQTGLVSPLVLTAFTGSVLRWERSTDNFATANPIPFTGTTLAPPTPSTRTCFRAVVSNMGCQPSFSSPACIDVNLTSLGGVVNSNQTICSGDNPTLQLVSQRGNVVRWESSADNFINIVQIPGTANQTAVTLPNVTQNMCYRAIVQNGVCSAVPSARACLTVVQPTIAGSVMGAATVCASDANLTTLCLSGSNGAPVRWERTADAVNYSNPTPINHSNNCEAAVNITTTTCYRALVQNIPCPPVYTEWTCITAQQPPVVYAGPNATSCATVYELNGNSPEVGTGTWSVSPVGPVFANTNDPRSMASNLAPGQTYVFTWTIDDGLCTPVSSNVTISVDPLASNTPLTATAAPASVCPGQQATISASGAATYSWQPTGGLQASFTDNPTQSTTYTVTGTSATGCTSTAEVTVNVFAPPAVVALASSEQVCAPSEAVILYAFGAENYVWQPVNLTEQITAVIVDHNSTYTVTGTDANGCTNSATVSISMLPSPATQATASATTICRGGSTLLSASGANSYLWQPGNLSGSTATVSPTATTVYTVTGYALNGCSSSATLTVQVNPLPTVSTAATPIARCQPGTVILTATGAQTYKWLPGNLIGPTVSTYLTQTTTFTVTGTTAGCTASNTVTVAVGMPSLTVNTPHVSVCSTVPTTLTASGNGSFLWQPGNFTGPSITVAPTSTTTYTVKLTTEGGCSASATATVTLLPRPAVVASTLQQATCVDPGYVLAQYQGPLPNRSYTYSWQPGNLQGEFTAVQPSQTTVYTVTIRDAANGCTNSSSTMVQLAPQNAVIQGLAMQYPSTHGPVMLSGTPSGGVFSGPGVVGDQFHPASLAPGIYTVCYNSQEGDCPYSACQNVEIISPTTCTQPSNAAITNVNGTSFTLNWPAVSGALSYEVEVRNMSTNAIQSLSVTPPPFPTPVSRLISGLSPLTVYWIRVRSICSGVAPSEWAGPVFVQTTPRLEQLGSINGSGVRVYPNPNQGHFTVSLNDERSQTARLSVHDLAGHAVWQGVIEPNQSENHVELPEVAAGVYLLRIEIGGRIESFKLMVQ